MSARPSRKDENTELLRAILEVQLANGEDLRAIRSALDRQTATAATALTRRDRAVLVWLLPAIELAIGDAPFRLSELSAYPALVTPGVSAKALGKLFARATGVLITGLAIERVGQEDGTALWRVTSVVSGLSRAFKAPNSAA